jgi:hypothetical protein
MVKELKLKDRPETTKELVEKRGTKELVENRVRAERGR